MKHGWSRGVSACAALSGLPVMLAVMRATVWSPGEIARRHDAAISAAAAKAYDAVEMIRLDTFNGVNDWTDVLAHIDWGPAPDGVSELRTDELATMLAEFSWYRFNVRSSQEYIEWQKRTSHEIRHFDELVRVHADFEHLFGEPIPASSGVEEVFARFFDVSLSLGDGANDPVAVANDRKGLVARFGVVRSMRPSERPWVSGDIPLAMWHVRGGGTMRSWWRPVEGDLGSIIEERGEALCATIGLIVEYLNGSRRPLVFTCYWHPSAERWEIDSINAYNSRGGFISAMEHE